MCNCHKEINIVLINTVAQYRLWPKIGRLVASMELINMFAQLMNNGDVFFFNRSNFYHTPSIADSVMLAGAGQWALY